MPGVLVVEAMAQAGGVLLMSAIPDPQTSFYSSLASKRRASASQSFPATNWRIEVDVKAWRMNAGRMEGKAFVGTKRVAEALISCVVVPRKPAAEAG